MIIQDISVTAIRIPPATNWEDATNTVQNLEFVFVEIKTQSGHNGVGFTYSVDVGGSAILSLIENYLSPLLIGQDAGRIEHLNHLMLRQTRRLGFGFSRQAVAAFDIALWDLNAKSVSLPLHKFLGGYRESIPVYISEINLSSSDSLDKFHKRLEDYFSRGYSEIKIKIGTDNVNNVERLRLAKQFFQDPGKIFVDVNQGWSLGQAKSFIAELEQFSLGWIEEPFSFEDICSHQELRSSTNIPIALGESLFARPQFLEYFMKRAVDIVQADVAFVSGVTEWIKIAILADSFGKQMAPHYLPEISLPLLCAIPNSKYLEEVVGGTFFELGFTENPMLIENGVATPSPLPGHGIEISLDALDKKYRFDRNTVYTSFRGGSK